MIVKFDIKESYVTKTLSRCVTEYTHPMYDELVKECIGFVVTPIETKLPKGYPMIFEPKCSAMQICWGILPNTDDVVKLRYIIDSSD